MASTIVGTTQAVLGHHLQAVVAHNLDDIMSDFDDNSVVLTANGVFRGPNMIRGFFTEALKLLPPEVMAQLKMNRQEVDGEFAYLDWSAGPTIPMASDTFCVRNGKIVMQSFAA